MATNINGKYNKVVFLDRDGVINEFPGNGKYVTKVKDLHVIPSSVQAIKSLTESGYTIFVISNQAGVGKKIFTQNKLGRITNKLIREVERGGGKIKGVYYSIKRSDEGCEDRKPRIGSIIKALKSINKPLSFAKKTFFVGDTKGDIEAGYNAGCSTIFVLSGREGWRHIRKWERKPQYVCKDLFEAAKIIQDENSSYSRDRRFRS